MDSVWEVSLENKIWDIEPYGDSHLVVGQSESECLVDAETGRLRWTTDGGNIAAIGDIHIYETAHRAVRALDRESGKVRWQYTAPKRIVDVVEAGSEIGLRAWDTTEGDEPSYVAVIDVQTGEVRTSTTDKCWSVYERDGTLYFYMGDSVDSFDRGDITTLCSLKGSGQCSGLLDDHNSLYFGCQDVFTGVLAIAKGTGAKQFASGGYTNDMVLDGQTIYAGFGRGSRSAALDVQTGSARWTTADEEWFTHDVVKLGSRVYFRSNLEITNQETCVHAVDADDGSRQWEWRTDSINSLDWVPGLLLAAAPDGLFGLDPDTGNVRWELSAATAYDTLGDDVFAADGNQLYHLDPETGAEVWATEMDAWGVGDGLYVAEGTSLRRYNPDGAETATTVYESTVDDESRDKTRVYTGSDSTGAHRITYCPGCGTNLTEFERVQYCPNCGRDLQ